MTTKFEAIEEFIKQLESVFNSCGLKDCQSAQNGEYCYFRTSVPSEHANDRLVLRYAFTQTLTNEADNTWHSLDAYINATIFVNSSDGFLDSDYQNLLKNLELNCKKQNIAINYGVDDTQHNIGDDTTETKSKEIEFSKILKRR